MDKGKNLKIVEMFKRVLSEKLNVKKLILFGSRARGDFKESSDFDLIVVSDDFESGRGYERAPDMYRAWNLDYAVDFICLTSGEFDEMKNRQTIVNLAVKEGVEV